MEHHVKRHVIYSMINGYKWSIFHSYVSYYQRVHREQIRGLHVCLDTWLAARH
jgi:hypothetical protein